MKSFCQVIVLIGAAGLPSAFVCRANPLADAPLPTLEEIFPRAIEQARHESENDRLFESKFAFVKTKVTEYRNAKGEVKKRVTKVSTNDPALKRPPSPVLTGADRDPENARAAADKRDTARNRAYERKDFRVDEDMIKRFEFTLVGRDSLDERPVLVVDFVPAKRKLPERDLKDKFINKVAGRVWLDEQDLTITKAALRLTDRVNVAGGLVGAVWKLSFDFERERTAEGLWFTREAAWHLEGRELFTPKTVDYHEERTNVQRMP